MDKTNSSAKWVFDPNHSELTFKVKHRAVSMVLYYFVYATGILLGMLLLWLFKYLLPFRNFILTLCVLPFTMASNFILSKLVFDKVSIKG